MKRTSRTGIMDVSALGRPFCRVERRAGDSVTAPAPFTSMRAIPTCPQRVSNSLYCIAVRDPGALIRAGSGSDRSDAPYLRLGLGYGVAHPRTVVWPGIR